MPFPDDFTAWLSTQTLSDVDHNNFHNVVGQMLKGPLFNNVNGKMTLTGSGAGTSPELIGGLTGWWKADAITGLNNNDAVSTWIDSSGNGFNASQSNVPLKPIYKTNFLNGKPVLEFHSRSIGLTNSLASSLNNGTGATAFAVFKSDMDAQPTSQLVFFMSTGTNAGLSRFSLEKNQIENSNFETHVRRLDSDNLVNASGTDLTAMTNFVIGSFDTNLAARDVDLYLNGVHDAFAETTAGTNFSATDALKVAIGDNTASGVNKPLQGYIAEIVYYNHSLTTSERSEVELYLGSKYNIAVTSGTSNLYPSGTSLKTDNRFIAVGGIDTHIVTTGSLPAASAGMDGHILIEDNGTGDRNLIIYAGGQRFRLDGGAAF